ncbi:TrbI/VirB10 family protein [Phenylobacterium sp.]|uniref:TrbI/VirB10 family protein n=1 Tax=Phenylobacterium sp. TaxID=1871053 RepID=UPI0035B328E7
MTPPRDEERALARRLRLRAAGPVPVRLRPAAVAAAAGVGAAGLAAVVGLALSDRSSLPRAPARQPPPAPALPEALRRLPRDYVTSKDVPVLGPPRPPWSGPPAPPGDGGRTLPPAPQPDPRAEALQQARESRLFSATAAAAPAPAAPVAAAAPEAVAARTLPAGAVLRAALVTAIRSDVPGPVIAQVIAQVPDLAGGPPLVPQGARLIGAYAPASAGEGRLRVTWARLVLPDGRAIALGAVAAVDPQGRAGLGGRVERPWGRMLAASLASLGLAAAGELGASSEDDLVRALRRGVSDTAVLTGGQAVARAMDLRPVISVPAGTLVRAVLLEDVVFTPAAPEAAAAG